jgi:hypothetical protein
MQPLPRAMLGLAAQPIPKKGMMSSTLDMQQRFVPNQLGSTRGFSFSDIREDPWSNL